MNNIIRIERRNVYGNDLFYCIDAHAPVLAKLTGKKTLTLGDMKALEQLGFVCLQVQS